MNEKSDNPYVVVLGIAQDAGYPQANCDKECCRKAWENPKLSRYACCLGLVDPVSGEQWLFDATPDIKYQLRLLESSSGINPVNGIFLTHAHIGHYTGLMQFGREVMGVKNLPVYAMNRMRSFIKQNAPWSQLVEIKNIDLIPLADNTVVRLNERISITPFLVPHRGEFSETVGFKITTADKSLIFIPDIDRWEDWEVDIAALVKSVDYAFLDATFFQDGELGRDMREIPHPIVKQTMEIFKELTKDEKETIHFIHFNHTNPLLRNGSEAQNYVKDHGFKISEQGQVIEL